jgi:hypothetical protein
MVGVRERAPASDRDEASIPVRRKDHSRMVQRHRIDGTGGSDSCLSQTAGCALWVLLRSALRLVG